MGSLYEKVAPINRLRESDTSITDSTIKSSKAYIKVLKLNIERKHSIDYKESYYAFFIFLETLIQIDPTLLERVKSKTIEIKGKSKSLHLMVNLAISSPYTCFREPILMENILSVFMDQLWPSVLSCVELESE